MHDHSTASMEGLLHVAKKVSSVNAALCNFAWLIVPAFKSLIMWTMAQNLVTLKWESYSQKQQADVW